MRFRVRTESDSFYVIDTKAKTMVRCPGAEGKNLTGDFTLIHWDAISAEEPQIGEPLVITWKDNLKARITTPIVEVVRLSDPA